MAKLDRTDLRILEALQKDAKLNMKQLATDLNISKTPLYERVRRLEEEGYIKNYVALLDNKKIGMPLIVFCNITLSVHNDDHIVRFREEITCIEEVMECYSVAGVYDFLLKVVVKDLEAYDKFVFEKITKVYGIAKMNSSFVLSEFKHTTALSLDI